MFDEQGVCNVCRAHEFKKDAIDWDQRRAEFRALVDSFRGKHAYDCIIPFSGGKDSTFTLYHMVTEYQVKPLVVQFDHGFFRPRTLENNVRTFKRLGVDTLSFRPNWRVVRKLMLESLKRKGDFCWHCHTGIFSYPMQIAVKFGVPLLIWGEPSAEYTSYYGYDEKEEVDEKRFNRATNLGITADDMIGMIDVDDRDLEPFRYPALRDLRRLGVRSVCLGTYIPWDVKNQAEMIKRELGWQGNEVEGVPSTYEYEKIECFLQGVRDYLRYLKRGYGRTAHLVAIDIRNGRLTADEARELISEHDGKRPASLDVFLEYLGLDEEEFLDLATQHVVSPWTPDVESIEVGKPVHDMKAWDRTIPLQEI
jgi:N-acetyl sugar amidotransferase